MKWQIIPKWNYEKDRGTNNDDVDRKWLKYIGATLHSRPELQCDEWRLSYFAISQPYRENTVGKIFKIYIPFMRKDHGIILY